MIARHEMDSLLVHDLLRNRRRRHVLEHMNTRVGAVTVSELAERIAEIESDESPPPRDLRRSVYNSLHQTHLPKLDEAGVVDYRKERKTVDLRGKARSVNLYMEVVTPYGITWAEYYRSLGVLGLLMVVAGEVGVPVLAGIPDLVVPVVFLTTLAVSSGYQLWSQRWMYLRQLLD